MFKYVKTGIYIRPNCWDAKLVFFHVESGCRFILNDADLLPGRIKDAVRAYEHGQGGCHLAGRLSPG